MPQVYEARNHADAGYVCGLLQAEGIDAEVRGDALFALVGAGPQVPGVLPAVWILDPAQESRARARIARYLEDGQPHGETWTCACGEVHEPQFTACWKCGAERPG